MSAATEAPDLEAVLENVREAPDLTPDEKETSIGFTKPDDTARVYTAEAGLMRRFIAHPESTVRALIVHTGKSTRERVTLDRYEGRDVTGVILDIPVGALQVKSASRKSDSHAAIVSQRVLKDVGGAT